MHNSRVSNQLAQIQQTESICSLGYHSHTGWVVYPQIFLLYDSVLMSEQNYRSAVQRGEQQQSTWAYIVSELLKEYKRLGMIELVDYHGYYSPELEASIEYLLDGFFKHKKEDLKLTLSKIVMDQVQVQTHRLKYYNIDEPGYKLLLDDIGTMEGWLQQLQDGNYSPSHRAILKHYLEQIVLSQIRIKDAPVFDWKGCHHLRHWLGQFRSFSPEFREQIQSPVKEKARVDTLNMVVEVLIHRNEVTNSKQISEFLKHREELAEIRSHVNNLYYQIWEFVSGNENQIKKENLGEFTRVMKIEVDKLRDQLSIVREIQNAKKNDSLSSFILTASTTFLSLLGNIASLIIPIIPDSIADGLSATLPSAMLNKAIDHETQQQYPDYSWISLYQNVHQKSLLKVDNLKVELDFYGSVPKVIAEREVCEMFDITPLQLRRIESTGILGERETDRRGRKVFSDQQISCLAEILVNKDFPYETD